MAPESSHPKRKARENQFPFDLGVKGRKTGLTLPELGERDENGMEPMDHLFSSPEKPLKRHQANHGYDATLSEEEDMEFGESTTPGPIEALAERKRSNARLPVLKSKTPVKTYLQSPARRNAAIVPISSQERGSIVETQTLSKPASVQRKLQFSKSKADARRHKPPIKRINKKNTSNKSLPSKITNGQHSTETLTPEDQSEKENESDVLTLKDKYQGIDREQNVENEVSEPESDNDLESRDQVRPISKNLPRNRNSKEKKAGLSESSKSRELQNKLDNKKTQRTSRTNEEQSLKNSIITQDSATATAPNKNKAGRPKKTILPERSETDDERPYKRSRRSLVDDSANEIGEGDKKTKANKSKSRTKAKISPAEVVETTQSQLAPPLPKSQGLLILRHETVEDNKSIQQTRSGRNSIKPLAFWNNEKVEFEDGELTTKDLLTGFTGRKIKHVIRAEEISKPTKNGRSKSRSLKSKKRKLATESESDEDEFESWELDPGRIIADIRNWDPEDQSGSNTDEREEEIALSSSAIITRDIANASFRFAKTLTLPFFGAGMVDLPPGSEKKQKNSRKMQMAFFVFYGKVQVTVNDNVFRISKGGMWQVPRGNFYGIQNDYDKPARIFFSQGCEIEEDVEES